MSGEIYVVFREFKKYITVCEKKINNLTAFLWGMYKKALEIFNPILPRGGVVNDHAWSFSSITQEIIYGASKNLVTINKNIKGIQIPNFEFIDPVVPVLWLYSEQTS